MARGLSLSTIILTVALVAACATPAARESSGDSTTSAPPSAPKRLVAGILEEPKGWAPWAGRTSSGGAHQPQWLLTRSLTTVDDAGASRPELAVSVPTVEAGDWKINPDGTMEQTWRLKPNLKWHDGTPLTADDFVFGYEVETHPGLPSANSIARAQITSAVAPDPQTLVLRFKGTNPLAAVALFNPYPRQLLGAQLAADPEQFSNLDYWTTAYVGAGPYRLVDWQPGAFQTFAAFADYVGGRPKIDTIVIKFLQDPNTLVANLLGSEVEVALPDSLSAEIAGELKRGWAAPGTGNQVIIYPDGRLFRIEFQHRAEFAKPTASRDPRVRRAFYYAIDKAGVNEVSMDGLGVVADSWLAPDDPRRPQFRDAIADWSYDLGLAQRILEEAGWRRGADGVLVHAASGERMDTDMRVTVAKGHVKLLTLVADSWRQVGALMGETVIPAALQSNNEYRATFPFANHTGHTFNLAWEDTHYSCRQVARAETRWSGNRNGYCNPAVEPLIERLQVTIPEAERTALQTQIMRVVLNEDYAQLPLYWQVEPLVFARSVVGPKGRQPGPYGTGALGAQGPWNIHQWDKQ